MICRGASLLLVLAAIAVSCAGEAGRDTPGKGLRIVCTTGMVGDLVANIAGDRADVIALMGPGVDPHYYKASQSDVGRLSSADVIFYNGLHLEGKMQDIFQRMARTKTVVPVSEDIDPSRLRRPPEFEGQYDPHIWFDVALWRETIGPVVRTLASVDPEGADIYRANGKRYKAALDSLDSWVTGEVATIPREGRVLVTAHDAFGYFGATYEIDVVGLQGISTVAEYGVSDVIRLVDTIVAKSVKAIFMETSVPERSIHAVLEGCRARGADVTIGGALYSDAMGAPGSGADTYVGMVRSNVTRIVSALK